VSERVFLGLGANLGDRERNLREALRMLAPACEIVAVSSLFRSAAVVPEGAPPGPDFLNAACEVATALAPEELLAHVQRIERGLGRRPAPRWSARPIDIDILLYGDRVIEEEGLTVPHPLLTERAFVLAPLAELAPHLMHPRLGRTIVELRDAVADPSLERIADPAWADVALHGGEV